MAKETTRPLKVFLCHASGDKPQVRALYKRLVAEGVDAWLDQEKLLPGQDWRVEIPRAVRVADVVVVCLSNKSITKEGYIQKEIKFALDVADEKPEGAIFIIPARLEDCPVPDKLSRWHWVDLFEENGYAKLLRSLKKDADSVGAIIGLAPMEESDEERDRKIEQLYTEGLAAYYTEDWDRACQRFQLILRERPNHRNALEKLEEAELQRDLSKLYLQATQASQAGNWQVAIQTLDELLKKKPDYRDSAQLLRSVRQQKQLNDLYTEAKKLHAAEKWQAVLKVFQQIAALEPAYPDPKGLLPSAQKEAAELKRLADLNELYSQGIHKMDAGEWYEARSLLEQVHKAQTGFLDTERLLRKVENEILKIEEGRKREAQVQVLYEQARKLSRAGQWGKALTQIEEILKLDKHFADSDGIAEKAKAELEREEQKAQQRMEVAALYAESVSLLEAKKYQEALEKWNEVQAVDPKYKDTARVTVIARRKLDELSRPEATGQSWSKMMTDWLKLEANISADREMLIEKLLLVSFVAAVIIHELWARAQGWFHVWEWESVNIHVLRFVVSALEGGPYGAVVAFALSRTIYNWQLKHSLTVIVGWALVFGVFWLSGGFFDVNSITALSFSGLATAVAIKWAKPATSLLSIIIILVGWAMAWWVGQTLGGHLSSIYVVDYYTVGNALSILLGLLFTFGIQIEESWEVLKTAFFGALGFAVGNYVSNQAVFALLPSETVIANLVVHFVWGFIGGAILESPSRDTRRILLSAGLCGAGLLSGNFVYSVGVPYELPLGGIGLGLGLGMLLRRASAIGVLVVLGAGVDAFTSIDPYWQILVRGGLIGLVIGYGYGYMRKAKPLENKLRLVITKPIWIGIVGFIAIAAVFLFIMLSEQYREREIAWSNAMTCQSVASGIEIRPSIESPWLRNETTVDGKLTTAQEWSDAVCLNLSLIEKHIGPAAIASRWWIKNDAVWLYLLARVPVTELEGHGAYIDYFWGQYVPPWEHSDFGTVGRDNQTFDGYGYDDMNWKEDVLAAPPGQNNVQGKASQDTSYYWFEFRKTLNSGEAYDWAWGPGDIVEADLLIGIYDQTTFFERYIQLHLGSP